MAPSATTTTTTLPREQICAIPLLCTTDPATLVYGFVSQEAQKATSLFDDLGDDGFTHLSLLLPSLPVFVASFSFNLLSLCLHFVVVFC